MLMYNSNIVENVPCILGQINFLSGTTELIKIQYIQDYFRVIITLCQNSTKDLISVLMSDFHTCSQRLMTCHVTFTTVT